MLNADICFEQLVAVKYFIDNHQQKTTRPQMAEIEASTFKKVCAFL